MKIQINQNNLEKVQQTGSQYSQLQNLLQSYSNNDNKILTEQWIIIESLEKTHFYGMVPRPFNGERIVSSKNGARTRYADV